ncbi:rod shape-determining protein RodA [Vulgatibacter incomptus]|uniref:Peptidoglycan glycosyltransferase RodA n=1 Tax=Vulgatibacter incomptus TaxID=1391653 RepID=A0A0K1PCF8_9BACT|nr:rod shape-determining protein RodA [Vulgatibacter incomptus]AKU91203.1 Rod shape-determining protein RodA [Vulgatibacter incomptus]
MSLLGTPPRADARFLRRVPWEVFAITLAIGVISVGNLASASRVAHAPVWISQIAWLGIGLSVALVSLSADYRMLHLVAWPFYALVILLLVAVELHGQTVMGAQRWLVLGPLRLQPSELAKLAVVFVLARFYHEEGEKAGGYTLLELWKPAVIIAIPFVLILHQPDLGTASMMAAIAGTMVLASRVRWKALATIALTGLLVAVAAWFFVLHDYQKKRVLTFLDPEADVLGSGYHANQSMIAVGSGQWAGKGWAQGTQTQLSFLPEQHTDFVFSVFAEEWGFRGAIVLLGLYLALCLVGLRIAAQARERQGAFLAIGAVAFLFWHVFVNIGMVSGLLPVVGVTLPLMSYGGSSAVTVLTSIGLLANVGTRSERPGRGGFA